MPLLPLLSGPIGVLLTWIVKKTLPADHAVTDWYKPAQPAIAYVIAAGLILLKRPDLCGAHADLLACASSISVAPISTLAAIVGKEVLGKLAK